MGDNKTYSFSQEDLDYFADIGIPKMTNGGRWHKYPAMLPKNRTYVMAWNKRRKIPQHCFFVLHPQEDHRFVLIGDYSYGSCMALNDISYWMSCDKVPGISNHE